MCLLLSSHPSIRSLDVESVSIQLAEKPVLNYLGPVPPSAFHSKLEPIYEETKRDEREEEMLSVSTRL